MDKPDAQQREDLGRRIQDALTWKFDGVKSKLYQKAEVNAQTLDNALAGKPLAERTLLKVVRTIWPETGGDWRRITPPLGSRTNLAGRQGPPVDIIWVESELKDSDLDPRAKAVIHQALEHYARNKPPIEIERGAS